MLPSHSHPLSATSPSCLQMVRLAAGRAVGALARALGPAPVLAALGGALVHPSWRAREEGANAYSAALLAHPKERLDYPACVRALAAAAGDEHPRVAAAALEAFVLLHARLGALLAGLMTAVGAPEEVKRAVAERAAATPQLGLPALDAQGNLVHQASGVREWRGVGMAGAGERAATAATSSSQNVAADPEVFIAPTCSAAPRPATQRTAACPACRCRGDARLRSTSSTRCCTAVCCCWRPRLWRLR